LPCASSPPRSLHCSPTPPPPPLLPALRLRPPLDTLASDLSGSTPTPLSGQAESPPGQHPLHPVLLHPSGGEPADLAPREWKKQGVGAARWRRRWRPGRVAAAAPLPTTEPGDKNGSGGREHASNDGDWTPGAGRVGPCRGRWRCVKMKRINSEKIAEATPGLWN
uniref:Uncharacterized protein n=1 Tax=Triticum urartu TaxID=4572 RepID=A0A8R7R5F1_TRIUA